MKNAFTICWIMFLQLIILYQSVKGQIYFKIDENDSIESKLGDGIFFTDDSAMQVSIKDQVSMHLGASKYDTSLKTIQNNYKLYKKYFGDSMLLVLDNSKEDSIKIKTLELVIVTISSDSTEHYCELLQNYIQKRLLKVSESEKSKLLQKLSRSYSYQANFNWGIKNHHKSFLLNEKAIQFAEIANDSSKTLIVVLLSFLPNVYYCDNSMFDKYLKLLDNLKIPNNTENETLEQNIRLIGFLYTNLANLALRREEYRDCISFGLRALKLCDKYNSDGCKSNILRVSRSLADSYNKLHMKDSVLFYYEKSIIMPVHKMDSIQNSETYIKIGDWLFSRSELDSARKYYLLADNFQSSYQSLFKLGKLAQYQNNLELNRNYLLKALMDLDQPIPKYILSQDSADMATHISDMFIRYGDYKSAFKYYKQLFPKSIVDPIKREAEEFKIKDSYNTIKYQQQKELFELDRKLKLEEQQKTKNRNLVLMAGFGTAIAFLILAFISIRNKRKRDVAELSEQITSVEMKALRSQMNPHFIFNSLQSIQNFLISNKPEDANEYLLKFSKLMRLVLENSQMQDVTLKDDILTLELYMQLEKLRFTKPFEYEIVVEASVDIDADTIPPLLLQPFVENAIWHGLQYKTDSGNILIRIKKEKDMLICVVEDNGVGRSNMQKLKNPVMKKESLGMKLTEERIILLQKIRGVKATLRVVDLYNEKNVPEGTRVEVLLPLAG